jgi:hypothetical protein
MDREPPEGHIGTREAAERLGLTAQAVRNMLKDGRLNGHDKPEYGEGSLEKLRYWVRDDSTLAQEVQKQADRRKQLAKVEDVNSELAASREVVISRFASLIEQVISEIDKQRDEVVTEIRGQRTDVLKKLTRMEHRQADLIVRLDSFLEDLREAREGEQHFQQETIRIQEQTLELQKQMVESYLKEVEQRQAAGRESEQRGFWRRLFGES